MINFSKDDHCAILKHFLVFSEEKPLIDPVKRVAEHEERSDDKDLALLTLEYPTVLAQSLNHNPLFSLQVEN